MSLLDNYKPRYEPPKENRKYIKQTSLSQQERDSELNNFDRSEVTEDFSDSPFADRK